MSLQTTIKAEATVLIDKPPAVVGRFIADEFFDNYPRWSPEVTSLEKITPGPVRIGTIGRQVRNDAGYVTESTFRITAYEPLREISFASTGSPPYRVRYLFLAAGDTTRLRFSFELTMTWLLKPFEPIIARTITDQSRRMVDNIGVLLQG
jgi:hypothetical protein